MPHQMREVPLKWGQLRGRGLRIVLGFRSIDPGTKETRRLWKWRRRRPGKPVLGWTARQNTRD